MFDIGWTELAIVALIALLVIGPKELPATMRMIAGWIGKIRSLAREFQGGLDDMMRETELDKLKEQAQGVMHGDIDGMVENTIDPDGTIRDEFDYGSDYEPFGDFDEPEPETKPKPETKSAAAKRKTPAKPKSGAAATKTAKAQTARSKTTKPKTTKAKTSGAAGTKARTKAASKTASTKTAAAKTGTAKTPAKPRAKTAAKSSASPAAKKTAARKPATKPDAPGVAGSDS